VARGMPEVRPWVTRQVRLHPATARSVSVISNGDTEGANFAICEKFP
jgi:hypothetical protein